jgi:hypothetical protein
MTVAEFRKFVADETEKWAKCQSPFWRGETGAAWEFHGSDGSAGAPWLSTRLCRCGLAFTPFVSG